MFIIASVFVFVKGGGLGLSMWCFCQKISVFVEKRLFFVKQIEFQFAKEYFNYKLDRQKCVVSIAKTYYTKPISLMKLESHIVYFVFIIMR